LGSQGLEIICKWNEIRTKRLPQVLCRRIIVNFLWDCTTMNQDVTQTSCVVWMSAWWVWCSWETVAKYQILAKQRTQVSNSNSIASDITLQVNPSDKTHSDTTLLKYASNYHDVMSVAILINIYITCHSISSKLSLQPL
jgi:hypothetical protein